VGTDLHQKAISTLADMLESLRDEEGTTWGVGRNLGIAGFRRRDGTAYAPKPDVCVYFTPLPANETELSLAECGPPVLVVEVASPTTVDADVGEKAATYARGGVQEYLVFDVSGALLGAAGPVWARRLRPEGGGTLEPWLPEGDGRWHSQCGAVLAAEGALLRVYSARGVAQATLREERQSRRAEEQRRLAAEEARQQEHAQRLAPEEARQREEERRLAAEERLVALEEELRRLRGGDG
jgi:Uma2 family endonuclease